MQGNNLLRAIQMYDFYLYELNLYLDTHPNDNQALALFKKYPIFSLSSQKINLMQI